MIQSQQNPGLQKKLFEGKKKWKKGDVPELWMENRQRE